MRHSIDLGASEVLNKVFAEKRLLAGVMPNQLNLYPLSASGGRSGQEATPFGSLGPKSN